MIYAEAAHFDGAHVQHIADYLEARRHKRLRAEAVRAASRRQPARAVFASPSRLGYHG